MPNEQNDGNAEELKLPLIIRIHWIRVIAHLINSRMSRTDIEVPRKLWWETRRRDLPCFLSLKAPYPTFCRASELMCVWHTWSTPDLIWQEDDQVLRWRDREARKHHYNLRGAPWPGIPSLSPCLPSPLLPPDSQLHSMNPSQRREIQQHQRSSKPLPGLCWLLTVFLWTLKSNPSFYPLRTSSHASSPSSFPQSLRPELITESFLS